jgi:scyllo-inositol 2-dehydrogenase (NADP+)
MRMQRVGLIGYGLGGAVFHAPLIAGTPGLQLAAVVTRDPTRRAQAVREHPGIDVLDDADALWARAADLDLVVIASPNGTHAALATAALEAGLSVVVDKPFAPTAAEGRRVAALGRERGLLVVPFQNRRWDGDFLTVRRLLAEGALGDVLRFEARYERWRTSPKPRWTRSDAAPNAEGVIYDLGTHLIDQALSLFGPAREVSAELERRHAEVTVPDDAFVSIAHASGVRTHIHTSLAAAYAGPRFVVSGRRGAYVKFGLDPQEDALKAGRRPGDGPGWGAEAEAQWGTLWVGDERRVIPTEAGDYPAFYAGVERALRDGSPPPVRPEESIAGLEVIEAAQRAARERRAIVVGDGG